uniref:Ionotropic glutamate receptor L-glutamate and glycine-binding domain-containing protein n=1 Tax=Strigamia maritima TaxID=126957 RepID=T1JA42_STRMM
MFEFRYFIREMRNSRQQIENPGQTPPQDSKIAYIHRKLFISFSGQIPIVLYATCININIKAHSTKITINYLLLSVNRGRVMYLFLLIHLSLHTLCCIGHSSSFRCASLTLLTNNDNHMEPDTEIEFQYLGYKWLKIDNSLKQLSCHDLPISNIQSDEKNQYAPKVVKISHFDGAPLFTISNSSKIGGYIGQILNPFLTVFNISFKITLSKKKQYGSFINGSWTGMVGDLINGLADIAPALTMSRQRSDYINFSPPIFPMQFDVVFRKLDQHERNYTFYLRPCNKEIWLCVLGISLIVILVKVLANKRSENCLNCFLNFINDFLLCWPIVLLGNLNSFSLKSIKFVFTIYIAFSMLLLFSYSSVLTSLLATTRMRIPFSSLEDMLENTDYMPVVLKGHKLEEIFVNSPYKNKTVITVETIEEAIEETYSKKLGLLLTLTSVRGNCSFAVAPKIIKKDFARFAYSKQFDYRDYFNCKFLLLKQYGILSIEFERLKIMVEKCPEKPINPISFGQIIGPFVLIITGIQIALLLGTIELIAYKFYTLKLK